MIDCELPIFYQEEDINEFFLPNINSFYEMKNNDFFLTEVLEEFSRVSNELENSLLDYANAQTLKINHHTELVKQYRANNDELRELNENFIVAKIANRSFATRKKVEETEGSILLKEIANDIKNKKQ